MFKILFLLFIVMPIVEITVLMNVGNVIGVLPTIALVLLTAWVGAAMVRQQGLATLQSVQLKVAAGQVPSDEIIAAMLLLIAGVMLLTPGFITDGLGLLLLWPVSRGALVRFVQKHMVSAKTNKSSFIYTSFHQANDLQQNPFSASVEHQTFSDKHHASEVKKDNTIDGEFERKE